MRVSKINKMAATGEYCRTKKLYHGINNIVVDFFPTLSLYDNSTAARYHMQYGRHRRKMRSDSCDLVTLPTCPYFFSHFTDRLPHWYNIRQHDTASCITNSIFITSHDKPCGCALQNVSTFPPFMIADVFNKRDEYTRA